MVGLVVVHKGALRHCIPILSGTPPDMHDFQPRPEEPVMKPRNLSGMRLALLCVLLFFSAVSNGAAQDRLSKLEWFIEGGGSFLNLGKQPSEVITEYTDPQQVPTSGFLVSPNRFTSSRLFFTGVRYHLTAKDALEVAYSSSEGNHFELQPTLSDNPVWRSTFERHTWSVNYVRYLSERGALQSFVTAGLGPSQSISYITGFDRTKQSFNFGLGTDFRINERVAFRLEMRDYVGFLPAPLRGASHDLAPSAGLVFSPRTSTRAPARFPQVEVFLQGGASALTGGGAGPYGELIVIYSNGQAPQVYYPVASSKFSKSGRLLAGFRVMFSSNNALELSYSRSPNGNQLQQRVITPPIELPPTQVTLAVVDCAANYVRYVPWGRRLKPFMTGGAGFTDFAGLSSLAVRKFGWNAGVGADLPLWNRLVARFELRDYMAEQPAPATGVVHNIAPTAGLAYRFK